MHGETIYALSSGQVPAGIAVIRLSGDQAGVALQALAGLLPPERRATLATLRDPRDTGVLDRALVLWLPGPGTVTGEDMAELHCHGGRAVVAAVCAALAAMGLRQAVAGEFTRRGFVHGRVDLAQTEGLADLLSAETELQRRLAQAMAGGAFSKMVDALRDRILMASAHVEAALDFSDEGDVGDGGNAVVEQFVEGCTGVVGELRKWLDRPRAERLHDGFRVVLAGPPNSGKSTLFNALIESEAAITSPEAGTTRDLIERSVAIEGIPFTFVDTAGLRDDPSGGIEAAGIERALTAALHADLILWLGPEGEGPDGRSLWEIAAQSDRGGAKQTARARVSAVTGEGLDVLRGMLVDHARAVLPGPGEVALNARQSGIVAEIHDALVWALGEGDLLIIAEHLRVARQGFDRLIGRAGTEDMLDALFGRFCVGK